MSKTLLLYDGLCPLCRKTVAVLRRWDWLKRLQFHDARDFAAIPANDAHLDPARLVTEMHVIRPDRRQAVSGFRAVRHVARLVPVLWLVFPLLFLPGAAKWGQRLYLWIARNRFRLVPCRDGVCTIPPR